jgi:hypothetical protein
LELRLPESKEHHLSWLECVGHGGSRSGRNGASRLLRYLLHHMAMKLKRKLFWNPVKERFKNDDEANAMLSRPQR